MRCPAAMSRRSTPQEPLNTKYRPPQGMRFSTKLAAAGPPTWGRNRAAWVPPARTRYTGTVPVQNFTWAMTSPPRRAAVSSTMCLEKIPMQISGKPGSGL